MVKLSIVIPARNEEKRYLSSVLDSFLKLFNSKLKDDFEIILSVNKSIDGTLGLAQSYARKYKQVVCLDLGERMGKGLAVTEGFKLAKGDFIGFVDADGSTSAEAFYDLYKHIGKYKGILASRWMKDAKVSPKQSFARRFSSRGFNFLVRVLFGIHVNDTQCGAKLFEKKALKSVLPSLGLTQWAFDIDLLYQFKRRGYEFTEIPTVWADTPDSNLKLGKAIREMFLSLVRLRLLYSPFSFVVKSYDFLFGVKK